MKRPICHFCGYSYDPAPGVPEAVIAAGAAFNRVDPVGDR
ncbi:MAG TPA: rubredoxin [Syntrophales bacterium]|nr:rubredoxin [Syntrophales bacterium]HOL58791.1 rubredoxin [Syntrophales bacterium]HPO35118.1 rubredoxin [Syntrophales bacterium]